MERLVTLTVEGLAVTMARCCGSTGRVQPCSKEGVAGQLLALQHLVQQSLAGQVVGGLHGRPCTCCAAALPGGRI